MGLLGKQTNKSFCSGTRTLALVHNAHHHQHHHHLGQCTRNRLNARARARTRIRGAAAIPIDMCVLRQLSAAAVFGPAIMCARDVRARGFVRSGRPRDPGLCLIVENPFRRACMNACACARMNVDVDCAGWRKEILCNAEHFRFFLRVIVCHWPAREYI